MKIKSIMPVGKKPVYDLSVQEAEHYVLQNGIVTHNTGVLYSSDTVWIVGRQQDKDGTELMGWNFIINVEKSRFVKEKSKIPITVSFEGGILKWSGLLDLALESGHVVKPSNGWYQKAGDEKKYRAADTQSKDFWIPILTDSSFRAFVETKYKVGSSKMVTNSEIEQEYDNAGEV